MITRRRHERIVDQLSYEASWSHRLTIATQQRLEKERTAWSKATVAQHAALRREREAAGRSRSVWLRTLTGERARRDRELAETRRQLGVWLHGRAAGYRADADATPNQPKTQGLSDNERRAIAHELEVCARDVTGLDVP